MPFEVLDTLTKENMPPTASISYMRHVRKGKEMDRGKIKPKLIVTLPTVLVTTKREKFAVAVGTGQDQGKIRISALAKGAVGGIKGTVMKKTLVLRFGIVPRLGDEIFEGDRYPVKKIGEDDWEIELTFDMLSHEREAKGGGPIPLKKTA
jgi:hypothetical protein